MSQTLQISMRNELEVRFNKCRRALNVPDEITNKEFGLMLMEKQIESIIGPEEPKE